jgi:glycosyltransferase involved in cell wall biosynthesis
LTKLLATRAELVADGAVRSLHVAQTFGLYDAEGRTGHIAPLAARLAAQGNDVSVVAAAYPPHSESGMASVGEGDGAFPVTFMRSGFRYRTMTINPGARALLAERAQAVDVVHIHGLYDLLGPAAATACKHWRVPYVVETMGMFRPVAGGRARKWLFMRLLGRAMMRGAARFVVTSRREADDLINGGIQAGRVVVRHNGVEPVPVPATASAGAGAAFRAAHGLDPDAPLVLFLGRISPVKNIELLLAAFGRSSVKAATLVIAGPAEGSKYLGQLRQIVKSSQLGARVKFVGPLYGQDKAAALGEAALLALPSLNENFGTVALEAMAAGTPVVVTETCGVAEHVRGPKLPDAKFPDEAKPLHGAGGLVVGLNADDMRAAMDSLLSDEALRADLARGAKAIAARLTWDEAARLTTDMYREVLKA